MRRVQLVSGLLEQTSITSSVDRLNTLLGVELVDALTRYSTVLDVFDEVVSWREMVISELQPPVVRSSDVPPTVPSIDRQSVLAMLFKGQEEDKVPEVFSSFLQYRSV